MATGVVTLTSAASFIEVGTAATDVGADLVNLDAIRRGQPEEVTAAVGAYFETVRPALRSWGQLAANRARGISAERPRCRR